MFRGEKAVAKQKLEIAVDLAFELTVPFASFGLTEGDPIHFHVDAISDEKSVDRVPSEGALELTVPSPDFERIMWQA